MTRPATASANVRAPAQRSAITNGKRLPGGVCPTSAEARRFLDVVLDLRAEFGGALTAGEELLVRSTATMTLELERQQALVLRGEPCDSEQLTRVGNALARALGALRRSRAARKPTRRTTLAERMLAERREASE
jgi:hypothetical protein